MSDDNKDKENKEDAEQDANNKSNSNIKLIAILSVVITLILCVTVVAVVFLLKSDSDGNTTTKIETSVEAEKENNDEEKKENEAEDENKSKKSGEIAILKKEKPIFYSIRPVFVVNIDSTKVKFLQVSVDVMSRDKVSIEEIVEHLPLIQNDLISLFGKAKYEHVKTIKGREKLRKDALDVIKNILKREGSKAIIEDVLFTSFVMQ